MEVLYYFICSVKDNVPFILSNRANEIIQYLHNMVAVHPATSGFMSIWRYSFGQLLRYPSELIYLFLSNIVLNCNKKMKD